MSGINSAIDKMETLRAVAKVQGAAVAFVRVVTREETDSTALKNLYARRGRPGQHAICRADEPGSDYYRLFPEDGDIEIEKVLFDGFHGTDLEEQLRAREIDTVLVAGVTTDCCVDQTARSAFHRNFNVIVVSDACAAYEDALHAGGCWRSKRTALCWQILSRFFLLGAVFRTRPDKAAAETTLHSARRLKNQFACRQ